MTWEREWAAFVLAAREYARETLSRVKHSRSRAAEAAAEALRAAVNEIITRFGEGTELRSDMHTLDSEYRAFIVALAEAHDGAAAREHMALVRTAALSLERTLSSLWLRRSTVPLAFTEAAGPLVAALLASALTYEQGEYAESLSALTAALVAACGSSARAFQLLGVPASDDTIAERVHFTQ